MKIRGNNMMVFLQINGKWRAIAYATVCEIDISVDVREVGSVNSGRWRQFRKGRASWKINTSHLLAAEGYDMDLIQSLAADKDILVSFATTSPHYLPVDASTFAPNGVYQLEGNALLTRITQSARKGDKVTLSLTLTGNGELRNTSVDRWLLRGGRWDNKGLWLNWEKWKY